MQRLPLSAGLMVLAVSAVACKGSPTHSDEGSPGTTASSQPLVSPRAPTPAIGASGASASATGSAPSVQQNEAAPTGAQAARPAKPLNVILLTIDALRADMPWLGYPRPIAPNLTKMAEKGVSYANYRSTASYTAQSVSVMMTGRYVSTLYRSGLFFAGYAKSNLFISEVMQEKGIHTAGIHAHMYFERGKQLDQGFDVWETVPGITFDSDTDKNITADKHVDLIEQKLTPEFTGKQFFLWSHFGDPHDQYMMHEGCPAEWGKSNRDRYDCEVHFVDEQLGRFFAWGEKQPWWKDTAIIISSDHGEAFGEHKMWKHAFQLWENLVRIPAIVVTPGAPAHRIDAARTHIDLAPTIVDLMGLPPLPGFFGKTMVPEIYGAPADNREPIVLELNEDSHNPSIRAVIKDDWKLHVYAINTNLTYHLYNLKDDPGELKDLADTQAAKLEEMKKLFNDTYAKIPFVAPFGGMKLKQGGLAKGPMGPAAAAPNASAKGG